MTAPARNRRPWTAADDAAIRATADCPPAEAAAVLGRSPRSAVSRRYRLRQDGTFGYRRPRWTAAEDALLREHAALTVGELAALVGHPAAGIQWRRYALGLGPGRRGPRPKGPTKPREPKEPRHRPWGAEEDAAVLADPPAPVSKLAARFGRTANAVRTRRCRLRRRA